MNLFKEKQSTILSPLSRISVVRKKISIASTIPPEIISYDDYDFLDEIDRVNDLLFGNVELHSSDLHRDFETNENDIDESDDDEQLAEDNNNSYTSSEFFVELIMSDTDQKEQKTQSDIKENICGCKGFMVNHVVP